MHPFARSGIFRVVGFSCLFAFAVGCEDFGGDANDAEEASNSELGSCGLTDVLYASVNPSTGAELLTVWKGESDNAAVKYGYTERLPFQAYVSMVAKTGLSPVHRLYHPTRKDFLYTIWPGEVTSATTKYGYQDQGVVFYASQVLGASCASQALYSGFNPKTLVRHYDVNQSVLTAAGYTTIGTSFYTSGSSGSGSDAGTPDSGSSSGGELIPGLDITGNTIPDSNYGIPAGAIFMSVNGNDGNAGTQAAPVKTLNRAVALAPSGGTIVVRGGTDAAPAIYRDWYSFDNTALGIKTFGVIGKPVTVQAYPHEKAWFDGTDIIPTASWTSDGAGHWYMNWSTPSFCGTLPTATESNYYKVSIDRQRADANGPCGYHDESLDPNNPMAIDPQMVFIDGAYVHQVPTLAEATGNNFYYDWAQRKLYLGTNPSGHTVELAVRPMAMQLNGVGSKVLGLGFKRYATHQYPNNNGVIYGGAAGQTFEHLAFKQNAGAVIMLGKPKNGVINRSVFVNNGGSALGGSGSAKTTDTDNLLVQNSIFSNNNTERHWTGCSYSCGAAAIKLTMMRGFIIRNNVVEKTQGTGLGAWCDMACENGQYLNNLVRDNGNAGILHEISDTGIIASNLVYGNSGAGIRVCSAHTKIYNNTVVNNGKGGSYIQGNVWIYDDPRSPTNTDAANTGASIVGPDTVGLEYVNNVLVSDNRMNGIQGTRTDYTNTVPSQFFDKLDYNAYFRSAGANQVLVHWSDPTGTSDYKALTTFTAAHSPWDAHSVDLSGGADPFFVNAAIGDYRLRTDHQAGAATSIPADVLSALGLSSSSGLPKGAINWPGKL